MPTLPLYSPSRSPDGYRQTQSPGGYESWHLTLSDPASDSYLAVSLMTGCQYHPTYVRQFATYLQNPTDIAPPLPPEWPCAHLAFFRGGKLDAESMIQFPKEMFVASPNGLDVTMGFNRLVRTPDAIQLSVKGRAVEQGRLGPRHPQGLVSLELTLRTISTPLPLETFVPDHLWSTVASRCTAKGELSIRVGKGPAAKTETIPLGGLASLDHELGTRPIAQGYSAWVRGTAFLPKAVVPIRVACPKGKGAEAIVAVVDPLDQFQVLPTRISWAEGKRPYPTYLDASPHVRLDSPEVLDDRGPLLHVAYRATTTANETGRAVCQVLHPDHLPNRVTRMFIRPRASQ